MLRLLCVAKLAEVGDGQRDENGEKVSPPCSSDVVEQTWSHPDDDSGDKHVPEQPGTIVAAEYANLPACAKGQGDEVGVVGVCDQHSALDGKPASHTKQVVKGVQSKR